MVTVSIIVVNCLVFAVELSLPRHVPELTINVLGVVPRRFTSGLWGGKHPCNCQQHLAFHNKYVLAWRLDAYYF